MEAVKEEGNKCYISIMPSIKYLILISNKTKKLIISKHLFKKQRKIFHKEFREKTTLRIYGDIICRDYQKP